MLFKVLVVVFRKFSNFRILVLFFLFNSRIDIVYNKGIFFCVELLYYLNGLNK